MLRYQDITIIKMKKIAKNSLTEDVMETKTTITLKKNVLKHVVIALVSQNQEIAIQRKIDITLTKIIKLAKVFLMEAAVETTTTTPRRSTVLLPAKINQ